MCGPIYGDAGRRCLIPFTAEPKAVSAMRRAADSQLRSWGLESIRDAALLAVSELTTNVVRHVGEGTPAALVLRAHGQRVRLEVHDVGKELPHRAHARLDDEGGRGLRLVTAVSTHGWCAHEKAGGKVVACEFSTVELPQSVPHGPELVGDELTGVRRHRLLDESGRGNDLCLISLEVAPAIFVHSTPRDWLEVCPPSDASEGAAKRYVVEQIAALAAEVRGRFLGEVASIVSSAVMPEGDGMGGSV